MYNRNHMDTNEEKDDRVVNFSAAKKTYAFYLKL